MRRTFSCHYVAEKFYPDTNHETLLREHTVCLCDDDNDVEMASACGHAYIPEVSAEKMKALIEKDPEHFTLTGGEKKGKKGPVASEAALSLILGRFPADSPADEKEGDEAMV